LYSILIWDKFFGVNCVKKTRYFYGTRVQFSISRGKREKKENVNGWGNRRKRGRRKRIKRTASELEPLDVESLARKSN